MALTYIQLFEDVEAHLEPYEDAERGRLMMALMAYAFRGELPDFAGMPERYGWPALKMHVDRCMASYEKQKANGNKGGRPPKGETDKKQPEPKETQENPNKPNETQTNHNQDQSQDKDQSQEKKENNACAREEASSASSAADEDDRAYGFDGSDLTGACKDYDKAGDLVMAYKLPDTDQSRAALIEDANRVGWEKVEAALKDAALGNSRPMLSVNFYRKILESEGKPRPTNSGGNGSKGNDGERMLRYTPNERKATYSAAILDFDEVG